MSVATEPMCEPDEACPNCGERRIDYLEWDELSETVTCNTCGANYDPALWLDEGEDK